MELRTPAPLSDDEIHHFAESTPKTPFSKPPAAGEQVNGDVLSTPTPPGLTPRTMISGPVVFSLAGSEVVGTDSNRQPRVSKQVGRQPVAAGNQTRRIVRTTAEPPAATASEAIRPPARCRVSRWQTSPEKTQTSSGTISDAGVGCFAGGSCGDFVGIGRSDVHLVRHDQEDYQF